MLRVPRFFDPEPVNNSAGCHLAVDTQRNGTGMVQVLSCLWDLWGWLCDLLRFFVLVASLLWVPSTASGANRCLGRCPKLGHSAMEGLSRWHE